VTEKFLASEGGLLLRGIICKNP